MLVLIPIYSEQGLVKVLVNGSSNYNCSKVAKFLDRGPAVEAGELGYMLEYPMNLALPDKVI